MSTLRFEPIAIQLSKLVSIEALLPGSAVKQLRRDRPQPEDGEQSLPPDVDDFMASYMAVVRAAWNLLGAPQFDRLSRLYAQIEEEYSPGGPPMSPVYDSYARQHVLAEVPQGPANETPYSVLARLTRADSARERLSRLAQALADCHLDLYRVTHAKDVSAELEPVRGGEPLSVRLTGPFLRTGDRMLARVVPFDGKHFIADSPYLLAAEEDQWLAYLQRVSRHDSATPAAAASGGNANVNAKGKSTAPRPKLSSKQQARLRRQHKAAAQSGTPEAAIVRHLKFGSSERYWLDYIMDGYAGERRGIVQLAGVPDLPETLPHHEDYDPASAEPDDPDDERDRSAVPQTAGRAPLAGSAEGTQGAAHDRTPLPMELPAELAQQVHAMLLERLRATLDEPIAMFKGKTLRLLAREEKTRPDAIHWLREQERMLSSNPQLAGLNLEPLWGELGLVSRG